MSQPSLSHPMLGFASNAIVVTAMLAITSWLVPATAIAQTGVNDLPPDVAAFLSRRTGCDDWSRKAIRPHQFDESMRALRCNEIKADELSLRERYAADPFTLAALHATWVKVVKRLPVQKIDR